MTKEKIKFCFASGQLSCYSAVAQLQVLEFTEYAAWEYLYS